MKRQFIFKIVVGTIKIQLNQSKKYCMKNVRLIVFAVVALSLSVSSCKKDTPEPEPTFTKLTVEENKGIIEDAGIAMIDEMRDMENTSFKEVLDAFMYFADESDPFENNSAMEYAAHENELGVDVLKSVAAYDQTGMKGIMKTLIAQSDEPETIQDAYDNMVGVYSWNKSNEQWDFSSTGNIIEFLFPSKKNGTQNNASYAIVYEGVTISNPLIEDDYDGDYPKHIAYTLKVDGNTVSSYELNMEYNSDANPIKIENKFVMEEYEFSSTVTNSDDKKASAEFTCKHNDDILISAKLAANGDWSTDNIEDNTKYYVSEFDENWNWVEVEVSEDDYYEYSEIEIHKVIENGNASFQMKNIKVTGDIDVAKLGTELKKIDEEYDWDTEEEEIVNAETELLNNCMNLTLINTDRNEIIAVCEVYVVEDTYSWYDWNGNEQIETDYYSGFRFVFADGSKIDAETYFEEGFDDLLDELEDYFNDLEDSFDY